MVIPAGKHKIEFKFMPETVTKGNTVDLIASILMVGLLGLAVFVEIKKNKQ